MLTAQFVLVTAGIFLAGTVSGATGMAFPLIAGPIFLFAFDPVEAVALTALCSLTGQLFSIALLRRGIAYQFRAMLIMPGLCAVPLGTMLLAHCSHDVVRGTLGSLIVLSGIWGFTQAPSQARARPGWLCEFLVGVTGGITGGLVGASAVAPAIWSSWQGLSKESQRAILQPYILTMQCFSLVSLAILGEFTREIPGHYAAVLAPLLLGVASGVACFRMVSSDSMTRTVLSLVTVSGIALLLR